MKIWMLLTSLVYITHPAFSQKIEKPIKTKEEYLKTGKALKTTGWVLIGGGTIAVVVGTNITSHSRNKRYQQGLVVTGLGLLSGLVGLPFLITGDNMTKKANHMELSTQRLLLPVDNAPGAVFQPTLSWKFAIR